jgi:hypothetical protein
LPGSRAWWAEKGNDERAGARHLLALEFGDRGDFDDPRLGWRRLFSELLGAFFLVLVAAAGGLLHAKGQIILRGRDSSSISRAAGSGVLDPGTRRARQSLAHEVDAGNVDPSGGDTKGGP